jgi:hypothetical protein
MEGTKRWKKMIKVGTVYFAFERAENGLVACPGRVPDPFEDGWVSCTYPYLV